MTLREAIRALADAGYVESRRGRYGGTFVRAELPRRSRTDARTAAKRLGPGLEDALLLRAVLEVGAAEAAAAAALTQAERHHLRTRLDGCADASLEDYRRMDSRLHLAIAEVTGSASLTAAVADVRMRTQRAARRDPTARAQHRALQRAARADRRGRAGGRLGRGATADGRAPVRDGGPAARLPHLTVASRVWANAAHPGSGRA